MRKQSELLPEEVTPVWGKTAHEIGVTIRRLGRRMGEIAGPEPGEIRGPEQGHIYTFHSGPNSSWIREFIDDRAGEALDGLESLQQALSILSAENARRSGRITRQQYYMSFWTEHPGDASGPFIARQAIEHAISMGFPVLPKWRVALEEIPHFASFRQGDLKRALELRRNRKSTSRRG